MNRSIAQVRRKNEGKNLETYFEIIYWSVTVSVHISSMKICWNIYVLHKECIETLYVSRLMSREILNKKQLSRSYKNQ